MKWTVKRRLAAIGVLSIAASLAVGTIGFAQAEAASDRAERAFEVAEALATTIDSQHTAHNVSSSRGAAAAHACGEQECG